MSRKHRPGGNRVEIYSSGFFVFAPDWKPVVWDEEARGTGVYWGAALPESFLNHATPVAPDDQETDPDIPLIDPR